MPKENKNQNVNSNRRKILSAASLASAGALLSPLISKAAPATIIEAGSNVDTASYIIFQDSGMIYAKNGTTGKMEFQGSDASTVIQGAINALTSGIIHIKSGIYAIASTLIVPSPAKIRIEGDNMWGTELWASSNISNLIIVGDGNTSLGFGLNDIQLTGYSGSVTTLLNLRNHLHSDIRQVRFTNFQNGILIEPHGGAYKSYYTHIDNCSFQGGSPNAGTGIKFLGTSSWYAGTNLVTDCGIGMCNIGIDVQYAGGILFEMNDISYSNIGLKLDSNAGGNVFLRNSFEDNVIWDMQIISGADRNSFIANSFAAIPPLVSDNGTNTRYWHNYNYARENSGAITVADNGTIPHNLVSTPAKARLTGTVAGEIITVAGLDATNIKVAIKKPDGLSGTAQTIYWEAEA